VGEWDVDSMAHNMSSSLLHRWREFERVEPFGGPWENWLMAVPASDFASVYARKGVQVKVSDYMYEDAQDKKERQTANLFTWLDAKVDKNG
jgi:hypothetical protein